MTTHDVSDVSIPVLLMHLVNSVKPIELGSLDCRAESGISIGYAAREWLAMSRVNPDCGWRNRHFVDYLGGRRLKLDFSDLARVDSREYDAHYGVAAFARAVERARGVTP